MSRIADVLQKSRQERARRLRTPSETEGLKLRSVDDIEVPWQIDARPSAPSTSKTPPRRRNHVSTRSASVTPPGLTPSQEVVDLARTLFLDAGVSRPRRVLLSAVDPAGGSSTLAVRLALGLAQHTSGSIGLFDVDLAGGTLAVRLQLRPSPGLSDVVLQGVPIEACRQILPFAQRLSFVPVGSRPHELRTIMHDQQTLAVIQASLETCDYVIAHARPGAAEDAVTLGTCFDGVVLVRNAGTTSEESTLTAAAALRDASVRLLGTVLISRKDQAPSPEP